jgi:predicted phosphodiesterase
MSPERMRVAALYDIHANAVALRAVLAELEREHVDLIVVGGDAAPGPLPGPTIELLRSLGDRAVFVRGTTDRWTVEEFDARAGGGPDEGRVERPAAAWTATMIDQEQRDFLASFQEPVVIEVDGLGATLFCHGSPRSDDEILTALTRTSNSGAPSTTSAPPKPSCARAAGRASTTSCATRSWTPPTRSRSPSRSSARRRRPDRRRRDAARQA